MAKPWKDVEQSEGFKSLPDDKKDEAKRQYFDQVVSPQVPEQDREKAWSQFSSFAGVGRRSLPSGTMESTAGAGRGFINPPMASEVARQKAVDQVRNRASAHTVGNPMALSGTEIFDDGEESAGFSKDALPARGSVLERTGIEEKLFNADQANKLSRRDYAEKTDVFRAPSPSRRPQQELKPITTQERSIPRAAVDTVIGAGQGSVGFAKGIADNVLAGNNPVSEYLGEVIESGDKAKSGDLRNQLARRDFEVYAAEKNGGQGAATRAAISSLVNNPSAAADVIARGAGSLAPTIAMGALGVGARGMAATNALTNAGDSASQVADQLRGIDERTWFEDKNYAQIRRQGATHEQALNELIPIYALPSQAAGGAVGAISGATGVERVLAGGASGALRSRAARVGAELAGEQAETLLPQTVGNITAGAVDGQTQWNQGLGRAAVDTALGTIPGAALAATGGEKAPKRPVTASEIAKSKGLLLEPTPEETARLKSLQDAGEKSAAAIMQNRIDKRVAADSMGAEAEAMAANNPALATPNFQDQYKSLRVTGIKPVEAAARASVLSSFGQAAQAVNISPEATQAAMQAAQAKDIADLPGFLSRYSQKLAEKGIGQAIPPDFLESARDDAMETAMQSVYSPPAAADILAMEQDSEPATPAEPAAKEISQNEPLVGVEPAQNAIENVALESAEIAFEPVKPPAPTLRPVEVKPEPQKAAAPQGLRIGMTPKLAEPVTVRNGEIYIGNEPAINFETGDPVQISENATSDQIIKTLKDAGALSRRQRIFGNEQNPEARATGQTQAASVEAPAPIQSDAGAGAIEPAAAASASVEAPRVTQLGQNNIDLADGGKPFKTKAEADKAKKSQPMMRTLRNKGGNGYILADKTPAQIASDAQKARRISQPSAGGVGNPMAAHEFLAAEGGMNSDTDVTIGFGRNPKVGNRSLYAAKDSGRGLTLGQAAEKLWQNGYSNEELSEGEVAALIRRSFEQPTYTADGFDRVAQKEADTRFEDYMAAQSEAQDTEIDPFPLPDEYTGDIREESGYDEASAEKIQQWEALIAQAEAEGIDTETLKEQAHYDTINGTEQDYSERLQALIGAAQSSRTQTTGRKDSEQGREDAGRGRGAGRGENAGAQSPQRAEPRQVAKRKDGTLSVKGDPKEIKAELAQAGITNVIASKDGVVVGKTKADEAQELLTAPTREDILAQKDRAENAQELDEKAQIDREASGFTLQSQTQESRTDNTGDMFGGISVDDYQKAAQRKQGGTVSAGEDLFSQPDVSKNTEKSNTSEEPVSKTEKNEQVNPEMIRAKADLQNALADIADIFGKNTKLYMLPPEQEQKLLPALTRLMDAAFRMGYIKFKDAAKFALDQLRAMVGSDIADAVTLDHLQGAYIGMAGSKKGADSKKAVINIEDKAEIEAHTAKAYNPDQEQSNVPSPNTSVERDSGKPAPEPAVVRPVQDGLRGTDQGARTNREEDGNAGRGLGGDPSVSSDSSVTGGERGGVFVHRDDRAARLAQQSAGVDIGERGGDSGDAGIQAESIPASTVDQAAQASPARRTEASVKATPGLANIRETLPQLLPEQQEDVAKAEERFAQPEGYGMLFTNGTGTGKTFTGLGIIKRFAMKGKDNTLIVVPDDKIASDWIKSGRLLGLSITRLPDTKTAGEGIVITSYANLGENNALVKRNWDLVVPDEAHTLMQSANGDMTGYLENLRAITLHPDGIFQRHRMLHPEEHKEIDEINSKIAGNTAILNNDDTMKAMADAVRKENDRLTKRRDVITAKLAEDFKNEKATVMALQGKTRPRLAALSATPFAYEKTIDWANGYIFDYNEGQTSENTESRGYNSGTNRERFFMQNFGYTMRYNKLTEPDGSKVDRGLMQRQFNTMLKQKGVLSGRMLNVKADYDRRFILVDSAIGNRIDAALEWLSEKSREKSQDKAADGKVPPNGFLMLRDAVADKFDYLSRRYLLEAIKAQEAIPIVKAHMEKGRKVVVFHDYKKGGAFHPFKIESPSANAKDEITQERLTAFRSAVSEFSREFKDLVAHPFEKMRSPIDTFKSELPDVMLVNGNEKPADLLKRYEQFQKDDTGPQVMLVQSAKNKGWSGHDTTGKHQRVLINLGQPTAPTLAIQQEGRIYRTGQVSDAIMRYLNTGTNWEKYAFASTIAQRASAAENLGMGEQARALKDSFIQAFEEADAYPPGHEGEGKGGKERDAAINNTVSEFDRAKTFYWATQKKTSKTKASEGVDYFATPEPLGFKMVKWADQRGGESALEPSGGHGAIARWMPETTNRTVIEPSMALRSRLSLAMQAGDYKLIDGVFEDHNIVNKYDTIVMNPPFGSGGKTAVDHLAKAATHLRDGGRIVAIIPTGPAADKKFDKWMYGKTEAKAAPLYIDPNHGPIFKGDTLTLSGFGTLRKIVVDKVDGAGSAKYVRDASTSKDGAVNITAIVKVEPTGSRTEEVSAAEGYNLVADIQLPQSTFERAGTAVATRIVIIDKGDVKGGTQKIDLSNAADISELFDRIENLNITPRAKKDVDTEPEQPSSQSNARGMLPDRTSRLPEQSAKAEKPKKKTYAKGDTVNIGGEDFTVSVYRTNAGKDKIGVWMDSKEEAAKYSDRPFTTSANRGKWFVDQYYFPKDEPKQDAAFSRSGESALQALSQNDELFALPKSDKTTVEEIAAETNPEIKVRKAKATGLVENYILTMPNGAEARMMVRKPNPYGKQAYGMIEDEDGFTAIMERPGTNPDDVPADMQDVYIDVSKLKSGGDGATVYNIASTFAHNTGRIMIGDPAGLSDTAMRRRTEHMLSSALKFGTTRHLAPHPLQEMGKKDIGVPPMRWTYGDDLGNIQSLIRVSTESFNNANAPEITFSSQDGTFRDSEGGILDGDAVSLIAEAGSGNAAKAGQRSIKRNAVLRSLLRESSQENAGRDGKRRSLLERLVDVAGQYRELSGLFYSRGGVSQSQTQNTQGIVDAVTSKWKDGPQVQVVSTPEDLPIRAPSDARGLYLNGKIYIVASTQTGKQSTLETLAHEAIAHYGMRNMLGQDFNRYMKQINLAAKSGNKAIKAIQDEVRSLYVDDKGKFNLSERDEADEMTARVAQGAIDEEGNFKPGFGFVKSVYAKIVEFLRGLGLNIGLTMPELQGMLVNAQSQMRNGKESGVLVGQAASRSGEDLLSTYTPEEIRTKQEAEKAALQKEQEQPAKAPQKKVTADQVDMFNEQGALFSRAGVGWNVPVESNKDRLIYELQDERIDLKRAQENIKKAGGTITENFDARLAETLYAGRVARRTENFIDQEAKPLLDAMARNNVSQEELGDYLHARHAPEANKVIAARNPKLPDGGAGTNSKGELMTTAAADAYIAAISPARKMVLDAMAKRVDAITKGTRQLLVNEGLASPEEIKGWEDLYKSYVPLFKDEALEGAVPHPLGTGFNVRGPASKQRMGSEKEVTNILAHVLMQREAALTRAEKNRVGLALYGLALSNPNPEFWTTIKPNMKDADIDDELQAMGVDPAIAQDGMRRAPTIQKIDPATGKVAAYPNPMYKSLPNAITVKVNGQDRVLLLNASNPRALRMAENLKNLDGLTKLDIAQSVVGKTTRWMASVNTQYNPAFGLVNVTRDILGAGINLGSTELRGDSIKVMANAIPAMQGIARDLAGNDGGEWGKLWRQFQDDGGRTGYRDMFREASDRAKDIEKELKNLDRSAMNPAKLAGHALDLLDNFNTTLENAVRVSAYKAALDKGMSRAEAARLARELTVDFNRKGRAGREIGPLYAFFNASVQGTERTLRTLAGPTGGRVIAGGLTLGAMQALMLLLAGYEDDEIPEWVKTRNLIIPTGKSDKGEKTHILIPMPLGLHVIPNTGRIVTEMILSGGTKAGKRSIEAIGEIAAAFNPIGGGNIFTADGALKTIAPTVVDPLIELGANKNFMGAPIEKSYDSEKDDRPGYARTRESTQRSTTGQAYIGISKAFNWATGGDQYQAGLISPSPEKIRYLAQVAGGGVLRELEKTIDSSVKAYNGEEVKKSGIPILGRFSGETDDQRTQQARFFKNSAELSTLQRRMKAIEKAGDADAYEKLFAENPKAAYAKSMNTIQRKLSELNRLAVSTVDDKEQIKAIDEARTELMRSMNDIIIEQEKSQSQKPGDKLKEAAKPVLEMVD